MAKSAWLAGLGYVIVLAILPLLGAWARREIRPACAHDGGAIEPRFRVRVQDADGTDYEFCCIACAQAWLAQASRPVRSIHVTDEISGAELDATDAIFVRSQVVTNRATGNRVHVFQRAGDAEHHALSAGGRVLSGADHPFATQ
jgi:hypothetical protein